MAFVDGRHYLGDRFWRPIGTYDWRLRRIDGDWKVERMTLTGTEQRGERALTEEAQARAGGR